MTRDRTPVNKFAAIPRYARVRKKRAKARHGPLRDAGYRRWLKCGQECILLKRHLRLGHPDECVGGLLPDPAHTVNNGTSSKGPDSSCVPLCRKHHREYDANRKAFERKYGTKCAACGGTGEILPAGPSDAPVERCYACNGHGTTPLNMREIAAQYFARYQQERGE